MSEPLNAAEILRDCRVLVAPETFAVVSVTKENWTAIISNPDLSPRMSAPFMILMDQFEVTLVLDDVDLANLLPGLAESQIQRDFRMLTFDIVMDFTVVGFIAVVSRLLADAKISILPISAFSRDHVLVKQADLAKTLKVLGPQVSDLC